MFGPLSLKMKTICLALILFFPAMLSAESIFLRDGSITEGKIEGETDRAMRVRLSSGKIVNIERSKILRVAYDEAYKKRVYLKRTNGKLIEGHVVEESGSEYTLRDNLDSPAEYKLDKKDVLAISGEKFISKGTYYALGALPGIAQLYADRDLEGGIFLGSSIASLGFAGYAYYDMSKKHDAYKAVPRGSPQADFDSKYNAYKSSANLFLVSLGIFGAIYIANWIDVIFFAKPEFVEKKKIAAGDIFFNISLAPCLAPAYAGAFQGDCAGKKDPFGSYMPDAGIYFTAGVVF